MTATVLVEVERREEVWQVPHPALRFVPDWPQERLQNVRRGVKPGEAIVWRTEDGNLSPLTVTTGIVGEKLTEIDGPGLASELLIAIPGERQETPGRRRFGLSLF